MTMSFLKPKNHYRFTKLGAFPFIVPFDQDRFIQIRTMPAQTGTDNGSVYPIITKQVLK